MKNVLIVGHCDLDHPQIASLIKKNFTVNIIRLKQLKETIGYLEKYDYDLVIINRMGAFDQESGLELITEIIEKGHFNVPLMMVTNYKDQMNIAIKIGAVPGYGKDKLYDIETIELLSKYLGEGK